MSEDEAEERRRCRHKPRRDDGAPLPALVGDEGDEDDEPTASGRRGGRRRGRPPAPPLEDEDDDMEDAEAPELLYREDDVVFARDGREDQTRPIVADCAAGATTVRIKWRTGRKGEYDRPISDVIAPESLVYHKAAPRGDFGGAATRQGAGSRGRRGRRRRLSRRRGRGALSPWKCFRLLSWHYCCG